MNAQPHGEIDAKVLELNDILGTITPLLTHSDKVRRIDLVKPVMESRNFEEMKTALSTTKTLIENLGLRPIPPQENNGDGWTTAR